MRKPDVCLCENKCADQQLCSNCEADQRFCFRYIYSTIPLLPSSEISSFWLSSVYSRVCVGPGRNPNCWFSDAEAHLIVTNCGDIVLSIPVALLCAARKFQ